MPTTIHICSLIPVKCPTLIIMTHDETTRTFVGHNNPPINTGGGHYVLIQTKNAYVEICLTPPGMHYIL